MSIERVTRPTLRIIDVLRKGNDVHWAYELAKETGLAMGTVQPILTRLEAEGWLAHSWEDIDEREVGRPRRRLYKVTGEGARAFDVLMAEHGHRLQEAPALRPQLGYA